MKVQSKFFILSATLFLALTSSAFAGGGDEPCGVQGSQSFNGCAIVNRETVQLESRVVTRYVLRSDAGELVTQYRDNESRIISLTNKERRQTKRADKIEAKTQRIVERREAREEKHRDKANGYKIERETIEQENSLIASQLGGRAVTTIVSSTSSTSSRGSCPNGSSYVASTCGVGYYPIDGVCYCAELFSKDGCDESKTQGTQQIQVTQGTQGTQVTQGTQGTQGTTKCTLPEVLNEKTGKCETPKKEEPKKCSKDNYDPKTQEIDEYTGECREKKTTTPITVDPKKLVRTPDYCQTNFKKPLVLNETGKLCVEPAKCVLGLTTDGKSCKTKTSPVSCTYGKDDKGNCLPKPVEKTCEFGKDSKGDCLPKPVEKTCEFGKDSKGDCLPKPIEQAKCNPETELLDLANNTCVAKKTESEGGGQFHIEAKFKSKRTQRGQWVETAGGAVLVGRGVDKKKGKISGDGTEVEVTNLINSLAPSTYTVTRKVLREVKEGDTPATHESEHVSVAH